MVLTKKLVVMFLLAFAYMFANAQTYVINMPNGNVSNTNAVSISWPITAGDSLIASFSTNGGTGTAPDTITDSGGNVYTLLKNPTGTPVPLGVGGFSTLFYVCLYPANRSIGVTVTSPLSGGIIYSYLNEWFICNSPGGCAAPGVLPPNQHVVADGNKWSASSSLAAFTPYAMPAYGGTIPTDGVSVGMFLTNDTSFYFIGSLYTTPIQMGGWDFGNDAIWGMGWVAAPSTITGEQMENSNAGHNIFANYAVFHFAPNAVSTPKIAVSVYIG